MQSSKVITTAVAAVATTAESARAIAMNPLYQIALLQLENTLFQQLLTWLTKQTQSLIPERNLKTSAQV